MKHYAAVTAKRIIKALLYGIIGAVLILLILAIKLLNDKPDLQPWHTAELDEEFTRSSKIDSMEDYRALEDRLFKQLDELVYSEVDPSLVTGIQRFAKGSLSDSTGWTPNWNRTFELPASNPRGGILLLHGLSDSPYSHRALGERLQAEGYHVLGLRIPGHGTAPTGLVRVEWEDMAAAVALGMKHLKAMVGEKPISAVGYSNGGALAVHYALATLSETTLPKLQHIVLISPEIGISGMAALAVWQERIGSLLGLHKLQWNSVLPEYDPYKYGSFAVNAGRQAHELTVTNAKLLNDYATDGGLDGFPPTLAFQSVVDSTVSTKAIILDLFANLPVDRDHELVVYDLNRSGAIENLLRSDPQSDIRTIAADPQRRFGFTVVANRSFGHNNVVVRAYPAGQASPIESELDLAWPPSFFSLSHVALPFAEDDPVYGGGSGALPDQIHLGDLALRGENGVLAISPAAMLRLRWNPFYDYQEARILDFLGGSGSP